MDDGEKTAVQELGVLTVSYEDEELEKGNKVLLISSPKEWNLKKALQCTLKCMQVWNFCVCVEASEESK